MRRISYVDFLPVFDFGRFVGSSVSDLDNLYIASERASGLTRKLLDRLDVMDIGGYTCDDFLRFFGGVDGIAELNGKLSLGSISKSEYYSTVLRFYRLRWASASAMVYSIRLYRDVFRFTLEN